MLLNTPPVLMSSLSAEWWRRWLCPELRATWEQCGSGAPGTATGRGGVHLQPDSVEGGPQGGGHHADSEHKQPGLPRWAVSGWNAHAPQDALMPQTHAFRLGTARSPARAVPKLVLVRAFHKLSWSGGLGLGVGDRLQLARLLDACILGQPQLPTTPGVWKALGICHSGAEKMCL